MGFAESWAAVEAEVGETEAGEASAVVLIQGMRQTIVDLRAQVAAGNPITVEQLDAIAARINASQATLAAAVAEPPAA